MPSLLYLRLIGFTAGTLLQLFWMVVILGYRRQRNFERVFFCLSVALFLFYSGSLLALNAQIYYLTPPPLLTAFAKTLLFAGAVDSLAFRVRGHARDAWEPDAKAGGSARHVRSGGVFRVARLSLA